MSYVVPSTPVTSVPVVGTGQRFPVHRVYCVGRNYEEHAKEMGFTGRSNEAVQAMIAADLAISVRMRGSHPKSMAEVPAHADLPTLGKISICLYDAGLQRGSVVDDLKSQIRAVYGS